MHTYIYTYTYTYRYMCIYIYISVYVHIYIYIYINEYQESSLEKVDILRAEVLFIRDVGARVRRQSEEDLRTGVRQGNHIALSVALQVGAGLGLKV